MGKAAKSPNHSLGKLIANADRPMFVLDPNRRILLANRQLGIWLGVEREHLLKLDCSRLLENQNTGIKLIAATLAAMTLSHRIGVSLEIIDWPTNLPPLQRIVADEPSDSEKTLENGSDTKDEIACLRISLSSRPDGAVFCSLLFADEMSSSLMSPSLVSHSLMLPRGETSSRQPQHGDVYGTFREILSLRNRFQSLSSLASLAGKSTHAVQAQQQVENAIATSSNTCVFGPKGTQRSEIAKAIFTNRYRQAGLDDRDTNIIVVQCTLMDRELFSNMIDLFNERLKSNRSFEANALLLEDLDQLPPECHELAFSVLNSGTHQFLATANPPQSELASNRNEDGLFPKLLQLISVSQVHLAPLTDRLDDLPILVQALSDELGSTLGIELPKGGIRIHPDAMNLLCAYAWPNNIVELRATLAEILPKLDAGQLKPDVLPISIRTYRSHLESKNDSHQSIELDQVMASFERQLIQTAMHRARGNKAEAARMLGIQRSRLLRKLAQISGEQTKPPSPTLASDETVDEARKGANPEPEFAKDESLPSRGSRKKTGANTARGEKSDFDPLAVLANHKKETNATPSRKVTDSTDGDDDIDFQEIVD